MKRRSLILVVVVVLLFGCGGVGKAEKSANADVPRVANVYQNPVNYWNGVYYFEDHSVFAKNLSQFIAQNSDMEIVTMCPAFFPFPPHEPDWRGYYVVFRKK